jgi:hypothetical protein
MLLLGRAEDPHLIDAAETKFVCGATRSRGLEERTLLAK